MVGPPNVLGIVAHIEGSWISRRRRKLDLAKKEACASTASFAARAVAAALGRHRAVLVLPPPPRASALARSSPEDSPSAAKEAASAEAVNARQGITGRLDSGVNGIIGVQVLLKKRKLDQPKKKCPYSLMTLPLFWMTGWGSVLRSPAGKLARMCLAISGETPSSSSACTTLPRAEDPIQVTPPPGSAPRLRRICTDLYLDSSFVTYQSRTPV